MEERKLLINFFILYITPILNMIYLKWYILCIPKRLRKI